jgi:hypothetical protein
MQTIKLAIVTVLMAGTLAVEVKAQDQGVNGLLMGAGGGALIGQAIGRDTEGTLIGTAVGGMLGFAVGNAMDRERYGGGYGSVQPATFLPPPPPHIVFSYRPHYRDRYEYRHHYRPVERCRKIVTVERRHGHYREVVRTVCRDRDRWRDGRHDHWRGDRYRDRNRW